MSNLNKYELKVLTETREYFIKEVLSKKDKEKNILSKTSDTIGKTFDIDTKIINQLTDFFFNCGEVITSENRILKKANVDSLEKIKLFELENCDQLISKLQFGQQFQHLSHGAATGAFGFPGLFVDIATSPVLRNKSLLELGIAYGFNKAETKINYTIAFLLNSANSYKEKSKLLFLLQKAKKEILAKLEKESVENITELFIKTICKNEKLVTYLITIAEKMGLNISKNAIGKFIPVIGAVFGGAFSLNDYNKLKETCQHHFRLDWLQQRGKITEEEYQEIILGKIN